MENNLHPTVKEFKQFLALHPDLVKEVRKNGKSWQEYYEKWALLGEDDPFWTTFENDDKRSEEEKEQVNKQEGNTPQLFSQLMKVAENVDFDKVQQQVHQLNSTISTVQELIDQFQSSKRKSPLSKRKTKGFHQLFRD